MPRPALTTAQRRLVTTVAAGAVLIAAIGFTGSYAAVRDLAEQKGFGSFALAFPIGIDIGIVVLLALDLLLAWLRMPYPTLRHTAWLLTTATIAFNGAAAWPDPLGTAMHAVIPVLFVVVVEAARTAVSRIADITADKHMDGVRLSRWLLSPVPTFRLWRRMKLWELRSYDHVIRLEQERLIYRAQLQADHGRLWRWTAPVDKRLQLRLARYGQPLPAGEAGAVPAGAPVQPPAAEADFDEAAAVALAPPAAALALPAAQPTAPPRPTPYPPGPDCSPSSAVRASTRSPPHPPHGCAAGCRCTRSREAEALAGAGPQLDSARLARAGPRPHAAAITRGHRDCAAPPAADCTRSRTPVGRGTDREGRPARPDRPPVRATAPAGAAHRPAPRPRILAAAEARIRA
ncbi:DUF2637 domain-containing protein, partial [Streptomyces sp. SID4944]|nr:DUF2637 domain-containing protein [Streptomyces sp. SID4944]